MEYRHLLSLLAVFVAVLASSCSQVEAAKRQDDIDDTEDGSGKDVQDSGSADDLDDEDHGSAGGEKGHTTISVYNKGVDISAADETESEEVKVEALTTIMSHPAVLAAMIVGGVITILVIVLVIMFVIYRMRKKDEGSYVLDDTKTMIVDHQQHQQASSSLVYIKAPPNGREFYA